MVKLTKITKIKSGTHVLFTNITITILRLEYCVVDSKQSFEIEIRFLNIIVSKLCSKGNCRELIIQLVFTY